MILYSKLTKNSDEQVKIASATGRHMREEGERGEPKAKLEEKGQGANKTEDTIVAENTQFYDHRGNPIPNLVLYDSTTNRGKKMMPNGQLKDCFIKNVRVTIGQFGINPRRKNDEDHIETIKEIVRAGVPGKAQSDMLNAIEERIKEKKRQQGRPED